MGRPRVSDGKPLSIRLDAKTRERLEALQKTRAGLEGTLAQVVREALARGIAELEEAAEKRLLADAAEAGLIDKAWKPRE